MTDLWGIDEGYQDAAGEWRDAPASTLVSLRRAMGATETTPHGDGPPSGPPLWFVRRGEAPAVQRPASIDLEDGTELEVVDHLPADLPLGYHDLHPDDGGPTTRLIVCPGRCHLPEDLRTWAWTVQLYAARSRASWGVGDLADLRHLAEWSAARGAGLLAVSPLHAPLPVPDQQPSPYFPSSRRFRSPLYLRVEDVPGAASGDVDLAGLAAAGRQLNEDRRIDRDAVWALKRDALGRLWERFGGDPAFDAYRRELGGELDTYATFAALVEHHRRPWRDWPIEHRHPDRHEIAAWGAAHRGAIDFHAWLQWLLDLQVATAGVQLGLVHDLAIGVDPSGADAWAWQDQLADGVRVGAPPDEFNTQGQDWGLPPFVPWKLRAARYEPLVQTLRAALRHAGGLRIDHVMGLFRLFWIPADAGPADGAYVRYRARELLDLVALESVRAGALVVGEDLGTVEDEARRALAERGVLSYRLVWFESKPPEEFPHLALAAVTTHDLPTLAGLWSGADLAAQRSIGLEPNEEATADLRSRLARLAVEDDAAGDGGDVEAVTAAVHRRLNRAPSMVVSGTLDDALAVQERPNMPGTTDEWPNWSIALPLALEDVLADPRVHAMARALAEGRSNGAEAPCRPPDPPRQ
ncbi:4-alpha-glucanotransferase [soil metagenome]